MPTALPVHFNNIRFSDGSRRAVLDEELDLLDDCVEVVGTVPVSADSLQYFHVELPNGGGGATLQNVLELRAAGLVLEVTAPKATDLQPGTNPNTDSQFPTVPEFTFFVYDHLGNTRVMYHNDMYDCQPFHTHYVLEHVLDYFPYGRTLREYLLDRERFETTYHERDIESGLDYRGARFYDGDIGRFLSTDPKAMEFAGWSTYNYTFDTPINLIDPDGRSPIPPPNDFFDTKGNYLGSDRREENNIRIVDPENSSSFNPNSPDALLKSTHLSLTHMSEEAVGKIGKYYLSNGLGRNDIEVRGLYNASFPFMAVTQGDGTSEVNSDGHMEFNSPVISISMTGGPNEHVTQGNLNNIYNFQNILYHETLHFNPFEITSSGRYRDVVPNGDVWKLNHVFIFHMMMSHPTFSKTTKVHQKNTRILMRREINLIEDSELRSWAKETFANDISED